MSLFKLKHKVIEFLEESWNSFLESSVCFWIKEKYFALPGKFRNYFTLSLKILFFISILYIPIVKFFSTAQTFQKLKEQKELIKTLKKVEGDHSKFFINSLSQDLSSSLRAWSRSLILLDEQKGLIKKIKSKRKVAKNFKIESYLVSFKKLNLKETLEFAKQIESLSPNTKITKLEVKESNDTKNYFSVNYEVSKVRYKPVESTPTRLKKERKAPKKIKRVKPAIKKKKKEIQPDPISLKTPPEQLKVNKKNIPPEISKTKKKKEGANKAEDKEEALTLREYYKKKRLERRKKLKEEKGK